MAWVWYCDSCDDIGAPVETREMAVMGGKRHRKKQTFPRECMVIVSPEEMHSGVAFAALIGAGEI